MKNLLPLPHLPEFKLESPQIVFAFDMIRRDLDRLNEDGRYSEFCWFAREYPRIYRYHINSVEYRLKSIYERYIEAYEYFEQQINTVQDNCFELAFSDEKTIITYWDFESLLSGINTSLDILARIIGTAYNEQTPVSFNKLCNKDLSGPVEDLKRAKTVWVSRLKDYRDCFTHYTPVDTLFLINARAYSDGWEVRAKLPINPNSRDIIKFKYSRRAELLHYAISSYRHLMALDKTLAKKILKLYKSGEFPKRISNLFAIGPRQ